jgi:RNA polymerase sigma factor (sigma-70 family)
MEGDVDTSTLLAAAGRGDQAAWDALVARHNGLLWSIARGYRLGAADAADAVQTTWLRLVENLGRITDPERLPGWLATTVRRECLQQIRRAGRTRVVADLDGQVVVDSRPSVEEVVLLGERDAAVWQALATLSERCQRLLRVLMAVPPPVYTDVAAALDIPVGSIGPTRQRCLGQLRKNVRGDDVLDEEARS